MTKRLLAFLASGCLCLLAACGSSGSPAPSESLGTTLDRAVPAAVLNAPLVDEHGKQTSLAAFRGKFVVLADSITLCQEICPLIGANFVQLGRKTQHDGDASKVQFVQLTIDPQRDSPARLVAYRRLYAPDPANWSTLTGPAASISAIWKYFGVGYQRVPEDSPPATDWWTGKPLTYDVQHTDAVVFLDGRQHERFVIIGAPDTAGKLPPQRLRNFLSAQGRSNLQSPDPTATWTVQQALGVVRWLHG